MKLVAFTIEGYRRFVEPTSVKLHGDIIALVGPNEAGKSSVLKALTHLLSDQPFAPDEIPRRTQGVSPKLVWHFQLDEDDQAAIADVSDKVAVERAVITKTGAAHTWSFEPALRRSCVDRRLAANLLDELRGSAPIHPVVDDEHFGYFLDIDLSTAIEVLTQSDLDDLDPDQLDTLRQVSDAVRSFPYPALASEEEHPAEHRLRWDIEGTEWVKLRDRAVATLDGVIAAEEDAPPRLKAARILGNRLPAFVLFEDSDRELASSYDLNVVADNPPPALRHVASLAGLDLRALRDEIAEQRIADASTRRNRANARLREAFAKSWRQHEIALQLEFQGPTLLIQATTPADGGLSELGERSDGLRWFAALLAFCQGWRGKPILLVDEIERHLHYDAQADLVNVLSRQTFASKVIYTTHSFGCLPHDLGTGVRVVEPTSQASSRLENGFWKRGPGFSPLLVSMGAAATSFTPTRRALIGEGPTEALLLPTILRQAAEIERLDFQVAPGLANVAAGGIASLQGEAGHVAYLVDGDVAGDRDIRDKLTRAGVPKERILTLRDGETELETEDLVDVDTYIRAVNAEMRCWNPAARELTAADVPGPMRSKQLSVWCEQHGLCAPDKAAVAQRVLEQAADSVVVCAERRAAAAELLERIQEALQITRTTV